MAHPLLRRKNAADGTNEELLNSPSVSDRADAKDYNSPFAAKGTEYDPMRTGRAKKKKKKAAEDAHVLHKPSLLPPMPESIPEEVTEEELDPALREAELAKYAPARDLPKIEEFLKGLGFENKGRETFYDWVNRYFKITLTNPNRTQGSGRYKLMEPTLRTAWRVRRNGAVVGKGNGLQSLQDCLERQAEFKGKIAKLAATSPVPMPPAPFKPWYMQDYDRSNGMATAPSHAEVTETAAFEKWFGKSKVVDESGAPLTVYHSSAAEDKQFAQRGISTYAQFGDWFDSIPRSTELYAEGMSPSHRPHTMAVYLSIQNPKMFDSMQDLREIANGKYGPTPTARMQKLRRDLKKAGHDGACIKGPRGVNYWVVFNGQPQIKNAIGNSGDFAQGKGMGMMAALKTAAGAADVDYLQLAKAIAGTIELLARIAPKGGNIQVWADSNHEDLVQFVKEDVRKQQRASMVASRKQAEIEMHPDPPIGAPRNDMRSHLDKDIKKEMLEDKQGSNKPTSRLIR